MNDLQAAFADAIEHLELPDVDLTPAVLDRIATDRATSDRTAGASPAAEPGSRIRRAVLVGVVAVAVLGVTLAVTPAGQAVADWFGIGSTAFEIDDPGAVEEDGSGGADSSTLDLGQPVLPIPDVVPIESLGPPNAVFDHARRGRTYVWNTGTGSEIRLSARSTTGSTLAIKSLASADDVEFLTVEVPNEPGVPRPYPGVWIGAPHTLSYPVEGLDLELIVDAGPVLIWVNVDDDVELRLEGATGKADAVALAAEVTEGTELLPPG